MMLRQKVYRTGSQTAIFIDCVFTVIESLCGMIDKSRSDLVRAGIEPIVANFNSDSITINLTTTLLDGETLAKMLTTW